MKCLTTLVFAALVCGVALLASTSGRAADSARSPFNPDDSNFAEWAPKLVDDAVMPCRGEVEAVKRWIARSFGRADVPRERPSDGVEIVVERQDYGLLQFGSTSTGAPFQIGSERFEKGLGTHANSRLAIYFPERIASFRSRAGFQATGPGEVQYAVEVAGREVWRSATYASGDAPLDVALDFDAPTDEIVLIVDALDKPDFDQANWLDPIAVGVSGREYSLVDEGFVQRLSDALPFSFQYGGVSSREFLDVWDFSVDSESVPGRTRYSWTDPETKLTVVAEVRSFDKFAAADWVLYFSNNGESDTTLLESVLPLDATLVVGRQSEPLALHTLQGDKWVETSWAPLKYALSDGETRAFAPVGGRPSDSAFPFWNLLSRDADDDARADGLFFALGWTGQWSATFARDGQIPFQLSVRGGMEKIATVLRPGETIRSPRALVMPWSGDRATSQALMRRLLMFEYMPKINGLPAQMDLLLTNFVRCYYGGVPGWTKVESQIKLAEQEKEIGCTAHWLDACWFRDGFPNGVGSWTANLEDYPNGLEELVERVKQLGMRFMLWFEPERVAAGSDIAKEYPQYVYGGAQGGLYKLDDPEARAYMTDLLLKRVKEYRLDVFRSDFNIQPLQYWRDADAPDRQGMTEIRYVEGLYEMWNRIREENPGLWIDNCASGGRRIDLDSLSISVPIWRSDSGELPDREEWGQQFSLGIMQYVPASSYAAHDPSPYAVRSAANPGAIMDYDLREPYYDKEAAIQSAREASAYQKFWYGDFYPLTPTRQGKESILAWQLHRSDLDAGLLYFFRQTNSPYVGVETKIRALDPNATYRLSFKSGYDVDKTIEISGEEFERFVFLINERRTALVVEYQKL